MCFDIVREGSGFWFLAVKEPRTELPMHDMELVAIVFDLKV